MTWIVCVALVCGHGLAAWILWLRKLPDASREEVEQLRTLVKGLSDKVAKAQSALTMRGMWGP